MDAEQQQHGAVDAVQRFAGAWRENNEWRRTHLPSEDGRRYFGDAWFQISGTDAKLTEPQLRAVLAERDALAARVAELEGELIEARFAEGSAEPSGSAEEATCPCGCQDGGVFCACTPEDCECIGDCPVCDAAEDEPADTCRPVTILGDDGEPIHTRVRGGEEMPEEDQAAFGEIVRAATRKHLADLRAEREGREADTRAVAEVAAATALMWLVPVANTERRQELWAEALDRIGELHARFADRIAALDADTDGRTK